MFMMVHVAYCMTHCWLRWRGSTRHSHVGQLGYKGNGELASLDGLAVVLDRFIVAMWCSSAVIVVAVDEFTGLPMSLLGILEG
jgi:hypothetical protein